MIALSHDNRIIKPRACRGCQPVTARQIAAHTTSNMNGGSHALVRAVAVRHQGAAESHWDVIAATHCGRPTIRMPGMRVQGFDLSKRQWLAAIRQTKRS